MEPPSKRRRLSPIETPDPTDDFDLQTARAQNDQKLKSIFEGIFEKYGRDFSDIGDEIDLETGEIVVNKGHVLRMEHEDDTGESPGLDTPKKAISQLLNTARERSQSVNSSDEQSVLSGAEEYESDNAGIEKSIDPAPDKNDTATPKHAASSNDNRSPFSSSLRQKSPPLSRAIDPLWQPPEIDAKFWTPQKQETPKKTIVTPHKEHHSSPPTTGSVWAIRTPGRPRGSTSKKQINSSNKNPPAIRSKRKRKAEAMLDWSFAQRSSDDSDSDDPLQEDAPPSSNRSIKIRGRDSVSQTPKAMVPVINNAIEPILIHDDEVAEPEEIHYDEVIKETTPIPDTPELHSSSPGMTEDTPSRNRYVINLEWPTFAKPEEVILTPDEVRLIIKMRSKYVDIGWEEIVEHLPGRTFNDLLNWADHHLHILDGTSKAGDWSPGDLEKLDKLADESGIWWRDFQTLFPHRSRKEIENRAIQLWVEKHSEHSEQQPEQDQEQKTVETLPTKRKPARAPYSDDNDPALKTGDVMTTDDLEELLEEDMDNSWSEISAIDAKARTAEIVNDTPRGSPRKSSVSPRKYY